MSCNRVIYTSKGFREVCNHSNSSGMSSKTIKELVELSKDLKEIEQETGMTIDEILQNFAEIDFTDILRRLIVLEDTDFTTEDISDDKDYENI